MDHEDPGDALDDFDVDGLNNLQEYQLGTDIRATDSDNDGLNDYDEVMVFISPTRMTRIRTMTA